MSHLWKVAEEQILPSALCLVLNLLTEVLALQYFWFGLDVEKMQLQIFSRNKSRIVGKS